MSSEIFEEDDTLKVEEQSEEPKSKEFRIEGEEVKIISTQTLLKNLKIIF